MGSLRSFLFALLFSGLAVHAVAAGHTSRGGYGVVQTASGRGELRPDGSQLVTEILSRQRSALPDGATLLRDLLSKPMTGPGGVPRTYPLSIERTVSAAAAGRAIARALPVVGTALAIKDLLDAMQCQYNPEGWVGCEGGFVQAPAEGPYLYRLSTTLTWYQYESAAVAAEVRRINGVLASNPNGQGNVKPTSCSVAYTTGSTYLTSGWVCIESQRAFRSCPTCTWDPAPDAQHEFQILRASPQDAQQTTATRCEFELAPDGTCTLRPTPDQFGERAKNTPPAWPKIPPALGDMDAAGQDYDTSPPGKVDGPTVIPGGRIVDQGFPDGSRQTVDRDWQMTYSPPGTTDPWISWYPRDVTRTWPPTVAPDPYTPPDPGTGDPGGTPGGVTSNPGPVQEIVTCGLPSTPPCKIDESGTPTWQDPGSAVPGLFSQLRGCFTSPSSCLPQLPSLNWTFALPSACSPIPMSAFEPYLTSIDICQYQPMIHDVMSVLWTAAGLFGAVALVFRDSVGG